MEIRYVAVDGAYLARRAGDDFDSPGTIPKLLGARLHIDPSTEDDGWVQAADMPNKDNEFSTGFVQVDQISDTQQLKIFYYDVGQGDATLIEAEGAVVIIDAGPNSGFHKLLNKRLAALQRADEQLGLPRRTHFEIDAVFISHFDKDHYQGLVSVLKDPKFKIGTIFHNGLPRYGHSGDKDLDLGTVVEHTDGTQSISTDFNDLDSATTLRTSSDFETKRGNKNNFWKFLDAAIKAHGAGRLASIKRLVARNPASPKTIPLGELKFLVLGPVTTNPSGVIRLRAFPDPHDITATNPVPAPSDSHTINGNSIVLRLDYKGSHFLFGGDLNQPAQKYLRERYGGNMSLFSSKVNKACHHGSSDYDAEFLQEVLPHATVFSSGDDGNHDHPMPDAIGAAARHSDGENPLVFSTELARDNKTSGGPMLGHINARSNGDVIIMAQKKESPGRSKSVWHTFPVPYAGPFGDH